MSYPTTLAAITALIDARNLGDVDAVLACYEPDATVVTQSGDLTSGAQAVRAAVENFTALKPEFTVGHRVIVEGAGVSLHLMRWRLQGTAPDGTALDLTGCTTDVFRRQPDGGWLLAIDNPWGIDIA